MELSFVNVSGGIYELEEVEELVLPESYAMVNHSAMYKATNLVLINFSKVYSNLPLDGAVSEASTQAQQSYCSLGFNFAWYTVLIGTLCLLGFAGNTLSVVILQRDRGNQTANFLLQALAVADNALLLVSMVTLGVVWGLLPYFDAMNAFYLISPYFLKYATPLGYMTKTCAIWMTVLLAVNRFVVIKKPLQAHRICTLWKARFQVLAVLIFSVLCNLPRFFQCDLYPHEQYNTTAPTNGTGNSGNSSTSVYMTCIQSTSVGRGSLFHIIYTNVIYSIFAVILPFLILLGTNVSLILELKRMRAQRNLMNVNSQPSDQNITLVMCIIIIFFLVCHIPDRILQGVSSFYTGVFWSYSCYLVAICNFLIIISSSSNFLVYYFVRKRFRRLLLQTICPGYSRRNSQTTLGLSEGEVSTQAPESVLRKLSRTMVELLYSRQSTTTSELNNKHNNTTLPNTKGDLERDLERALNRDNGGKRTPPEDKTTPDTLRAGRNNADAESKDSNTGSDDVTDHVTERTPFYTDKM